VHGLPPRRAAALGAVAVGVFSIIIAVSGEHLGRPAQALLLVVPVVTTAVLGGRRPAQLSAGLATLAFSLVLPPRGSPKVHLADDLVALVVFSIVAFAVGTLVAHRIDALERIERQRSALLRSVSHDLRTPLAAITTAAEELRSGSSVDPAARDGLLDLVGDEAMRLDRLVGNLLSLARVEAGALVPRRQAVDIGELVAESTRRLGRLHARHAIVVTLEEGLPFVQADYTLLEQVVTNLLENALRHSPAGSPVEVRASTGPDGLQLTVTDAGPGVPDEERAEIFEPFRTGATGGVGGIGLAICKAVAEAHGGTITVGGPPDGGAEFTVTLPLR
jgi:K+-sensing histidine kinase KdpD